jgi:hypothetical protein
LLFEREHKKPIENISEKQLRRQLVFKNSGGDTSFAILSAEDGSYVQMLGGGVICCLEWRDLSQKKHFRAYREKASVPWKENSGIPRSRNWFNPIKRRASHKKPCACIADQVFPSDVSPSSTSNRIQRTKIGVCPIAICDLQGLSALESQE